MIPVFSKSLESNDIVLSNYWVGDIVDGTNISFLIKKLNDILPNKNFKHLKRVHGKLRRIILYDTSLSYFDIWQYLNSKDIRVIVNIKIERLPKNYAPSHKLHEDQILAYEKYLGHINIYNSYMKLACTYAEMAKLNLDIPVGVVVLNPKTQCIIAFAYDTRNSTNNPLNHAIMNVINYIAKQDNNRNNLTINDITATCLISNLNHESTQYLCTNYYVFVTREPCLMCSMALLHSRVAKVFYGSDSPFGVLGNPNSSVRLHTVPLLNHHFEVYKYLLKEECDALFPTLNT